MVGGRKERLAAEALLVGITAIWGWTFVLVKDAVALYPTLSFLTLRFALATLVVAPVVLLGRRRDRRRDSAPRPPRAEGGRARSGVLGGGLLMGALLGAGYVFQTFGLEHTTASNAGFITGLFVVLVPLFEFVLWKRGAGMGTLLAMAFAAIGLFFLSGGASGIHLLGDGLVLLCAACFAAHILATAVYAGRHDAMMLTAVQLGVVCLVCGSLALGAALTGLTREPLALPRQSQVWIALVITAVLASAVAFFVQTYAQRHAPPARTAVIMTMEPVFAGVFGYALAGERLGLMGWIGAGLILAGMLAAEVWPQPHDHVELGPEGQAWVDVPPGGQTPNSPRS